MIRDPQESAQKHLSAFTKALLKCMVLGGTEREGRSWLAPPLKKLIIRNIIYTQLTFSVLYVSIEI